MRPMLAVLLAGCPAYVTAKEVCLSHDGTAQAQAMAACGTVLPRKVVDDGDGFYYESAVRECVEAATAVGGRECSYPAHALAWVSTGDGTRHGHRYNDRDHPAGRSLCGRPLPRGALCFGGIHAWAARNCKACLKAER